MDEFFVVKVYQRNHPAEPFWRSSIAAHTGGCYVEPVAEINGQSWPFSGSVQTKLRNEAPDSGI